MVCTSLATEGIEVAHGRHVLIADAEEDFTEAIVGLLRSDDQRRRLGRAAREWAISHAGWETSRRAYERLYTTMHGDGAKSLNPEAVRARVRELMTVVAVR
jgi:glycosyltransferase involved in cell wall biosynthesis